MAKVQYVTVEEDRVGQRLDNYLLTYLKGVPKSRIYRAVREGEIRINKKRVQPDYRLQQDDYVRIPPLRVPQATEKRAPSAQQLQRLAATIIYEDQRLLLINKPAGIASHGGSGIHFGVIELLRHLRPQAKFLELAHRLDRETTGCLLVAKKPSILKEVHQLFTHGQIKKTYLALLIGPWQGGTRRVDVALLKNQLRSGERMVTVHPAGKSAETVFKPLRRFSAATWVSAMPLTGRTHQIRVHAAYLGHPIIADDKYTKEVPASIQHLRAQHLLLHAASLEFTLPSSGEHFSICACLDKEFLRVLNQLKTLPGFS